jgi:hypothetical protein
VVTSAHIHHVGPNLLTKIGNSTTHAFSLLLEFVLLWFLSFMPLSYVTLSIFSICYDVIIQLYLPLPQPSFDNNALQRGNEALINFSSGEDAYSWHDRRMFSTHHALCYPTTKNRKCN